MVDKFLFVMSFCSICYSSLDGKILFWDIRMAKGQMLALDQHNGAKSGMGSIL